MNILKKLSKSKLPVGTNTEEWRINSAEIAFAFWSDKKRSALPSEKYNNANEWNQVATNYRAMIRFCLREAEKEGIKIRRNPSISLADNGSDDWLKITARLAWIIWLRNNRLTKRVDPNNELSTWEKESIEYRKFVRNVITNIEKKGYKFQA